MQSPPKKLQHAIVSRLKIMTGSMSIAEKRLPQDGRIQVKIGKSQLDLRVSTIPTNHGESVVMRILDKTGLQLGLPQLGFLSDDQAIFERLLQLPDGILLVTGPTGSGKSTTLYACLNYINRPDRKIITVEDPVEYQMNGINQVQVNADVGMTFPLALRSMLRQAPNIIMIGERRRASPLTPVSPVTLSSPPCTPTTPRAPWPASWTSASNASWFPAPCAPLSRSASSAASAPSARFRTNSRMPNCVGCTWSAPNWKGPR